MTTSSMSDTGGIGTFGALALMMLAAMVVMLALMGLAGTETVTITSGVSETVPHWLGNGQARVAENLRVAVHAKKHESQVLDAWKIYTLLLEGKCVASAVFCDPSGKKLYLCVDPVSGLIGGMIVEAGEIATGYGAHASYWSSKVRGSDAPFKSTFCYGR